MGVFGDIATAFTGSQGKGLGKDENLAILGNKLKLSNIGSKAAEDLQSFYKTGTLPGTGYTTGESYNGALGEYELSPLESMASEYTNRMIQQGAPELTQLAGQEYKDLLTTDKYDPMANKGTYFDPYKEQIMSEYENTSDLLDKQLAVTGDFYSTERGRQQRELAGETGRQLSTLLSDLYKDYTNKRLSGAQTAGVLGQMEQTMELQRIQQAEQQGMIERSLKDAHAKDAYNEWLRARSEYADILNTAMTLYSGTPVSSAFDTAGAGSAYTRMSTAGQLAQIGGNVADVGARAGLAYATGGASEVSGLGSGMFSGKYSGTKSGSLGL